MNTIISKIGTAAVYVDEQQAALRFWTEAMGFEVPANQPMGPEAEWLEVGPPGAESCLVIYPRAIMGDWKERKPSVVFQCDDIRDTFQAMSSRGVEFSQEPTDMAWGPSPFSGTRIGTSSD